MISARGFPKLGVVGLSFTTYKKDTGADVTPPSITEIGGGAYGFTPVFADTSHGIAYVLDCGATVQPSFVARFMRPEDWITDEIQTLIDVEIGVWQMYDSGPHANQLILYEQDGTTIVQKFDLTDSSGNPTTSSIFKRTPVS